MGTHALVAQVGGKAGFFVGFDGGKADGVTTLMAYHERGERTVTATDLNANGEIEYGTDGTTDFARVLDRSQDNLNRPTGWTLGAPTSPSAMDHQVTYAYSTTDGRLESVSSGADTFTYGYEQDSPNLLSAVSGPAHTVTNTWEADRNALATKTNALDASTVSSFSYNVNNIGQRTSVTTTGTAFSGGVRDRNWDYDNLGQLVSETDANDASFNRGYAFDGIGNCPRSAHAKQSVRPSSGAPQGVASMTHLLWTASIEGDTDTTAAGAVNYTPNALNQYTAVTGPRSTGVSPVYDDDGNATTLDITTDPLDPAAPLESSHLIWDAENRLIAIEDSGGLTIAEYAYDSQSRRIRRTIPGDTDIIYLYDDWNPIAEYSTPDLQTFTLVTKNTWGIDLSGTMQGAGGVGGLLSVTNASGTTYYPTFDGNGNVSEYLDATGTIIAHYEYDAFGNVINYTEAATGQSSSFRHRFSTKQQDSESGLLYYGYRYYDPLTGRWPSRDPIVDIGSQATKVITRTTKIKNELELYVFVSNSPIFQWDYLGLDNPGCDVPEWAKPKGGNRNCYLRCCAKHDRCYFTRNGKAPKGNKRCTSASWALNAGQVGGAILGGFGGGFLSAACSLHPCTGCNNKVLGCFTKCAAGFNPPGKKYFCPNGPFRGRSFNDWEKIPESCWENGVKPRNN